MTEERTLHEALKWASSFLEARGVEVTGAKWLLEDVVGKSGVLFQLALQERLPEKQWQQFEQMIQRFASGEPAQYITGEAHFYGRTLLVNPAVLIPRPETEELVELILERGEERFQHPKIVDIATGSGAIALTLAKEWPEAEVSASDLSGDALHVAMANAERLGVNVTLREGDLTEPFQGEKFHVIISNPPYIPEKDIEELQTNVRAHEHIMALVGGTDGLDFYRRLSVEIQDIIRADGMAFFEIGYDQGSAVAAIMKKAFPRAKVSVHADLNGNDRIVVVDLQ
ncbi:LOW QUALITY PROTEIN: methylase of polypeptide chain release factors [Geomicrobium sp. JCM 19039]|nr:LOW QUALITY PROTEIN: methylase of polypeptide chain release factors [Geomicrobium sp. JCM 19039]